MDWARVQKLDSIPKIGLLFLVTHCAMSSVFGQKLRFETIGRFVWHTRMK